MFQRVLVVLGCAVALIVVAVAGILLVTHIGIRRVQPPLPSLDVVQAVVAGVEEVPVRVRWINTASQETPRFAVLGDGDPHPDRLYRLAHSSFVLEWEDGRSLLIDAGMTRRQAQSFGAMAEWVGAAPIEVVTTVAERLGKGAAAVAGLVFTHLHVDHVDGAQELCDGERSTKIPVFMTALQANHPNYLTRGGLALVRGLDCLRILELSGDGMVPLPGFPGVYVIAAGGHTPGSQIVLAVVVRDGRRQLLAFAGDIVNNLDGIEYDVGKPLLYQTFVVPEAESRLGELRRFLKSLRDRVGFELLVSHDHYALEGSAVPPYETAAGRESR